MRAIIALLIFAPFIFGLPILAAAPGFAAENRNSLPVFFFRNTIGFRNDISANSGSSFIAETPEMRVAFRPDSVTFQVHGQSMLLRFPGSDANVQIEGSETIPGKVNFLLGQKADRWQTGVELYHRVLYRCLYPGIDLQYTGIGKRIKSEFLVSPGANPKLIRLAYPTAGRIRVDSNGDLVVSVAGAELREYAPDIFQDSADGGRVRIDGRYRLLGHRTAGFEIGAYDTSRPLIIDPVVTYCTYLSGSLMGAATGAATDGSGNLYVTGWTEALDFPVSGAAQSVNRGGVDAFIAKLSPTGTLLYATFIGGNGDDRGAAIAVDSSGQAYGTGSTTSTNFPLASAIRSTLGAGGHNAFAVKLNASGGALIYSTYLGGTVWDQGTAIAVDASGHAYIAGDTQSANFPVSTPAQATFGGQMDAFVAKLTPAGAIFFSTFLGGSASEHAGGIAVDGNGNVYVAGGTTSLNFPVVNALQGTNHGAQDAFVTKISPGGSAFLYSTYLGGNGGGVGSPFLNAQEQANAIAVDASGSAYVAGVTNSPDFPVTAGSLRTVFDGIQDAFVAKIAPTGNTLTYGAYLGGGSSNWASGIAVDAGGHAYVVGTTASVDFPEINPLLSFSSLYDAFFSEVNASGTALLWSTVYGGSGFDSANAIALDATGGIYIAGQTSSSDFPVYDAIRSSYPGAACGWVMRIAHSATVPSKAGIFRSSTYFTAQDVNGNLAWDPGVDRVTNFGVPGDQIVFGDWDGSGITKMGIFRASAGLWALDMNGNGQWDPGVDKVGNFGQSGDVAIVGDWTGDGKTKIGIYRPTTALFALDINNNLAWDPGIDQSGTYGQPGDQPIVGNWTGDGKFKVGIFRNGFWALDTNGNISWDSGVDTTGSIGQSGDIPLLGDWNGDGRTKVGVYRASASMFGLDYNGNLVWDTGVDRAGVFGAAGDTPIVGDWDGTGVTRIGIYRNNSGFWALDMNGNIAWDPNIDRIGGFGIPGDQPIVGRWQ